MTREAVARREPGGSVQPGGVVRPAAVDRPLRPRTGRIVHAAIVYGLLLLLTAFILLPIGWMVTAALKPDTAIIFTFPPQFFPTEFFHWQTFADALFDEDEPYMRYVANTTFLILVNMTFAVVSNSLIAYAFARLRFRGRDRLFAVVIATMLLPAPVLLIPQFLLFFQIGWYNTYLPLTIPTLAGNAFFIFLLRQYMRTIPRELDEAARMDGAGHWTIYRRIILPLSAPALTVVMLLVSAYAPARYAAEAFTWSATFIVGGVGAGMAIGGQLVEDHGAVAAFALAAVSILVAASCSLAFKSPVAPPPA